MKFVHIMIFCVVDVDAYVPLEKLYVCSISYYLNKNCGIYWSRVDPRLPKSFK